LNISHPVLISIGISLLDIIPVLGIGIILVPWAIIQLFMGNTYLGVGLGVLYIITVILRQVLEPIIIGKSIGLRPLYTLGITIAASVIIGPLGVVLGPLIAIIAAAVLDMK